MDPKRTAPAVIGAVLGFSAGSGGLDGNGGIPDLDLLAGIGSNRSPLTHTLIAGILAEGLLLALADLAAEVHGRLPHDHDPLWDGLARIGRPLTHNLAIGTGAGLAYHLLVDAFVQPGSPARPAGRHADGGAPGRHGRQRTGRRRGCGPQGAPTQDCGHRAE